MAHPSRLSGGRAAVPLAWGLAACAVAMCGFAVAGSFWATPTFSPLTLQVPPGAQALLATTAVSFAAVGALVAARVRGNVVGWLLLATGSAVAVTVAGIEYVALGLPGGTWAEWLTQWVSIGPFMLIAYVLLLFPDGTLVSQRWRPGLWITHVTVVAAVLGAFTPYTTAHNAFPNPVGISAVRGTVLADNQLGFLLLPVAIAVALASFVVRFRRSAGHQQAQLKWFALAGALVAAGDLVQNATWVVATDGGPDLTAAGILVLIACFVAVPVASGIAILRYRLYDIDRVLSRSLAYLLVTGIVVGVYVAVVAAATLVLPASSEVTVAAATLAAAAVFNPIRRYVQVTVDRRFNRRRYDAGRLVDSFAAELRGAVSVDAVQLRLSHAVQQAVEPLHVSMWVPLVPCATSSRSMRHAAESAASRRSRTGTNRHPHAMGPKGPRSAAGLRGTLRA